MSETFRANLDATAVRVSWDRPALDDPESNSPAGAARGGIRYNLWAALIQAHLPMIVSVRPPATKHERSFAGRLQVRKSGKRLCKHVIQCSSSAAARVKVSICKAAEGAQVGILHTENTVTFNVLIVYTSLQGAVLVFVYDMFSFAGPVLLQQLLQSLEDRSNAGEVYPTL